MRKSLFLFSLSLLFPLSVTALELNNNNTEFKGEVDKIHNKAEQEMVANERLQNNLKRVQIKAKIAKAVQSCMKNGGCFDEKIGVISLGDDIKGKNSTSGDSTSLFDGNNISPHSSPENIGGGMFPIKYTLAGLEGKWALFKIDGEILKKKKGDILPDGSKVSNVDYQEVTLVDLNGNQKFIRLEW